MPSQPEQVEDRRVWLITGASSGIKALVVEPGAFRTGLFGGGAYRSAPTPPYEDTVGPTRAMIDSSAGTQPGDPAKAADAILAAHADRVRVDLLQWEKTSRSTDFNTMTAQAEAGGDVR